jgi:hypothetical protein
MQGSDTFPWGSEPTVDTLEYIVFSGHVAPPEPSTWCGQVLLTTRLEIAARAPCLHTVVGGTPVSGYRHPPSTQIVVRLEYQIMHFIWLHRTVNSTGLVHHRTLVILLFLVTVLKSC